MRDAIYHSIGNKSDFRAILRFFHFMCVRISFSFCLLHFIQKIFKYAPCILVNTSWIVMFGVWVSVFCVNEFLFGVRWMCVCVLCLILCRCLQRSILYMEKMTSNGISMCVWKQQWYHTIAIINKKSHQN